jgi:DNA-binding SARP family transcriptional activator/predicted ATPase
LRRHRYGDNQAKFLEDFSLERLSAALSGSFSVTLNGEPAAFATDRSRALFAYLVVEADIPHRREMLAGLLWPEYPDSDARKNLSQTLVRMRRAIDDYHADPPYLQTTAKTIQFKSDLAELDINRFQTLITDCEGHHHPDIGNRANCIQKLEEAAELYRGNFLEGFFLPDSQLFEEWLLSKREQLHQQAMGLFHRLASHYENQAVYARAREYAHRKLKLEPWQEEAHRQIMRAYSLEGNRSGALAQYELCVRLLENELGVEPEPQTTSLYEQIKAGDLKGGPTTAGPQHNLPASLTPFRGRTSEISQLLELLNDPAHRLVTIVGEGGVGKTRLALAAAEQLVPRFYHGVWYVPLTSLTAEENVQLLTEKLLTAIAGELRLELTGQSDLKRQLFTQLKDKEILLILDNFEHLISSSRFLTELLQAAPRLKILVTSRFSLNLLPETLLFLEGMPVPDVDQTVMSAESGSVQLFMDVARRLHAPVLIDRDLPEIIYICRLVDGLPLGIEIAASWSSHFTCQEIACMLQEHFDSLTALSADLPERHRSLRAVFEYSWDLLSLREQQLSAQLSIFRGGFSRSATMQVTGSTLKDLAGLVGKFLIRAVSPGRYGMHERVKQFANEKFLVQIEEFPGKGDELHAAYSQFYLEMLAEKEEILQGTHVKQVFQALFIELDNIRQAWEWAVKEDMWELIYQAAHGFSYFYYLAGLSNEAEKVLRTTIEHLENMERTDHDQKPNMSVILGVLLAEQAFHLNHMARYDAALDVARRIASLAEPSSDALILTRGLLEQAESQRWLGFRHSARITAEKALNIARANGLPRQEAEGARCIAITYMDGGDHPATLPLVEQSLAIYKKLGDQLGIVKTLDLLAGHSEWTGHLSRAKSYREQSLQLALEMGNHVRVSKAYVNLAGVYALLGNYPVAKSHYMQSLEIASGIGTPLASAHATAGLAYIYRYLGDADQAEQYGKQAIAQAQRIGEKELSLALHLETGVLYCMQSAFLNARQAVRQAQDLARELDLPFQDLKCKLLSGWISSSLGENQNAVRQIEPVLGYMAEYTLVSLYEVFRDYYLCYQILAAAEDDRAGQILSLGYQLVQEWGSRIDDESLQRSFCENVSAHKKIISAWNERHSGTSGLGTREKEFEYRGEGAGWDGSLSV